MKFKYELKLVFFLDDSTVDRFSALVAHLMDLFRQMFPDAQEVPGTSFATVTWEQVDEGTPTPGIGKVSRLFFSEN